MFLRPFSTNTEGKNGNTETYQQQKYSSKTLIGGVTQFSKDKIQRLFQGFSRSVWDFIYNDSLVFYSPFNIIIKITVDSVYLELHGTW